MKINQNVYLFENIKGANSFLYISDKNEISIIDSGMPGNANKILSQISELDISFDKIKHIILTHADIDHMGSVADLKNATGALVAIHENEVSYLLGEKMRKLEGLRGRVIGLIFRILFKFIKTKRIIPDITLKEGDFIGGLEVIYSPGHTEGSISLYSAATGLFSGDAIITDINSNIKGFKNRSASDALEAAKTINKIKQLKFEILLPGHGSPVLKNASDKLKEYSKI